MDERPKGLVDGVDESEREKQKKQTTTMVKAGKWVLCTVGRLLARFVADELNVEFVGVN